MSDKIRTGRMMEGIVILFMLMDSIFKFTRTGAGLPALALSDGETCAYYDGSLPDCCNLQAGI